MRKLTYILLAATLFSVTTQAQEQGTIRREVTLYNPYKPSIPDAVKKSYLPDVSDTTRVRPVFSYEVNTYPYMPGFNISPLKPATMVPEALPKLYKSYVNAGLGNYFTPLAELSISNERSKKDAVGLYASHFSTNGKIELDNLKKGNAGFADNDLTVYWKRFMKKSVFGAYADFAHRARFAYGYDTVHSSYEPAKSDIRSDFYNVGVGVTLASTDLDSSKLSYNGNLRYDLFMAGNGFLQHSAALKLKADKMIKEFYAGSELEIALYKPSDTISADGKYYVSLNPFIEKNRKEWHVRLGFSAVLDKAYGEEAELKLYPDLNFGFSIIPEYLGFFASLGGRLERNEPFEMTGVNPFISRYSTGLFNLPATSYNLEVKAGLEGESGLGYLYRLSGSYAIADNLLLFTNYNLRDGADILEYGNYFKVLPDQAEILNIHAETGGEITGKISFETAANYWKYTLAENEYAWNRPGWDASLKVKYNLRDKIIAGAGMNLAGARKGLLTYEDLDPAGTDNTSVIDLPARAMFNLAAEYRYTKILSFWIRFDNIGFSKQYEWPFYADRRFLFLAGFSYSL